MLKGCKVTLLLQSFIAIRLNISTFQPYNFPINNTLSNTAAEYDAVIKNCKGLFMKKTRDYGTAWRILRIQSITDQIFIKAQRIRTLEEKKISKVDEDITGEYIGIVNYCLIAMMQLDSGPDTPTE